MYVIVTGDKKGKKDSAFLSKYNEWIPNPGKLGSINDIFKWINDNDVQTFTSMAEAERYAKRRSDDEDTRVSEIKDEELKNQARKIVRKARYHERHRDDPKWLKLESWSMNLDDYEDDMSITEYATFQHGVWPSSTVMTQTRNFCGRGTTQEIRLRPLIDSWTEISQEASKMGRPKLSGVSKKIANILSKLCGNTNPDKSLFQQCIQLVNSIEPGIKDNNDRSIQVSESYQYSMNIDDES